MNFHVQGIVFSLFGVHVYLFRAFKHLKYKLQSVSYVLNLDLDF